MSLTSFSNKEIFESNENFRLSKFETKNRKLKNSRHNSSRSIYKILDQHSSNDTSYNFIRDVKNMQSRNRMLKIW